MAVSSLHFPGFCLPTGAPGTCPFVLHSHHSDDSRLPLAYKPTHPWLQCPAAPSMLRDVQRAALPPLLPPTPGECLHLLPHPHLKAPDVGQQQKQASLTPIQGVRAPTQLQASTLPRKACVHSRIVRVLQGSGIFPHPSALWFGIVTMGLKSVLSCLDSLWQG